MTTATASPSGVVTFADGLPGFERTRHFVLVTSPAIAPFTIVQGTDADAPAFVAVDPHCVTRDFQTRLDAADLSRLKARGDGPLLWLALVTARPQAVATVNLRAPLVINPASMRGIQVVPSDSVYAVDHPLPTA
jgi:flagellar assembly factor FliW